MNGVRRRDAKRRAAHPMVSIRAAIHQHHVLGKRERLGLVVRHIDRGEAEPVLQDFQFDAHLVAQLRIEVRHRLVEQHQPRLVDQRAGKRDTLLLAAGQLRRRLVVPGGKADDFEDARDAVAAARRSVACAP